MDMPTDPPGTSDHRKPPPKGGEGSDAAQQQHLVELERMNRALRLLSSVNQALMHMTTEAELIRQTCEIAVNIGGYRFAWVGFAEHDAAQTVRPICHAGFEDGYLRQLRFSWADDDANSNPTEQAIRTKQPSIQPDIADMSPSAPWREAALARGYRSTIALPLQVDGEIIGALTLHGEAPYVFSTEEIHLLVELAGDLSYGISALRARERQRRAEEALRKSEELFRTLIEQAPVAIGMARHMVGTYANPSYMRMFGLRTAEDARVPVIERYAPECRAWMIENLRAREEGRPAATEYDTIGLRPDSSTFPMHVDLTRVQLPEGETTLAFITDITARKQVEEALKKSEERLRFAMEGANEGLWDLNLQTNTVYLSPRDCELFGYSPDDMPKVSDIWRDLVHPEDLPRSRERLAAYMEGRAPLYEVEERLRTKTGEWKWVLTRGKVVERDAAGNPVRLTGTHTDITERKQIEEALRESEERYRVLVERAPEAITVFDVDLNRFIDANANAERLFGCSREELLQRGPEQFYPPDQPDSRSIAESIPVYIAAAMAGEEVVFERAIRNAKGKDLICEVRLVRLPSIDRKLTRASYIDVTERRRTEQALREREALLRAVVDNAPFEFWARDQQGRVIMVNKSLVQHWGNLLGQRLEDSALSPAEMAVWQENNRRALAGELVQKEAEYTVAGEQRVFENIVAPIYEEGRLLGVMGFNIDITERKRAEATLRENEERLSLIVFNSPDLFYMLDKDLRYIWTPKTVLNITPEEAVGKTDHDIFPPAEADRLDAINRQVMATGESNRYELIIPLDQGASYYENTALPWRDAQGRVVGVLIYVHDITERKRTEETLRLTQFSVDRAGDMIFWMDFSGNLLYVNDAGCRRLGYSHDEFRQMTVFDIDPVFPRESWPQHSERLRQQGSFTIETQHRTKMGDIFPVEISINYIEYNGKEYNFAFARDITERKRAEEAIKRESTFLASAIELLPFPIYIITPTFEVIRQNRAGFSLQPAPNTLPLGGVEFLDPQTHTPCPVQEWPISHALQGETAPTKEFILRQQDGREISILLQTAPIFINEELVAAVVAIQDISALKAADRAKNQFLMVLSHEVKTPLTSIIGWAQLAQSAPDIVPEALMAILRNAQEQRIQLERLLILSRILTGKLVLARQPVDLWQLALHAELRLREAMTEHDLTFLSEPPTGELYIEGDGKLLEQAICEVVENAVNFTPTGGTITMQGRLEHETAVLVVHDTGQGIAPELLPSLLTPFTQLQRKEEIGGLGIGLAIVRGIIEAHGGGVTITSPGFGQGTTVRIELPLASTEEHKEGEHHGTT